MPILHSQKESILIQTNYMVKALLWLMIINQPVKKAPILRGLEGQGYNKFKQNFLYEPTSKEIAWETDADIIER